MAEELEKSAVEQLLESAKAQESFQKKALWHQRIRTILMLVLVIAIVSLVPAAKSALRDVQTLAVNAETVVADLSLKADELMDTVNALDLENTLAGIDTLVSDSSDLVANSAEDIETALQGIASLDIAGLNESIEALETIAKSIGRIFGYKG